MKISLFLSLLLWLSFFSLSAQKKFEVTIIPGNNLAAHNLVISVDNGKAEVEPTITASGSVIKIEGEYFGEYAEILIKYPMGTGQNFFEMSTFFVHDEPAVIQFGDGKAMVSALKDYKLTNATDFAKEKSEKSGYDSAALKDLQSFVDQYASKIFEDTALQRKFSELDSAVYNHSLRYILDNTDSYYAFSFFRRNFVVPGRLSPDSILSVLKEFKKFKGSQEWEVITQLANGRLNIAMNQKAPNFTAKDINGEDISLRECLTRGLVLLDFWATWCGPCLNEMPELKRIQKKYRHNGLTVISIAYPSTYQKFVATIDEYKMNWIQIYADLDLINKYGGRLPIPRTYLISMDGKIIFERSDESGASPLEQLDRLLASLLAK